MAADYTDSKNGLGSVFPDGMVETGWDATEPLISPDKMVRLHLKGIPLVSKLKNPLTGKPDVWQPDDLKEHILEAVSIAELEGGFDIFPRQYKERHAYDQKAMEAFGYFTVRHRPASSVEELAVTSSDGVNVWTVPNAWIESGYLHQGQVNMMPFAVAAQSGVTVPVTGPVGMGLLPGLFKFSWVPALWQITYTAGFKDGKVPRIVNQLIGVVAAMEVLSAIAPTYAQSNSTSLSLDGLSQSISGPGQDIWETRLKQLGEKRKWLIKKLQRQLGLGLIVDNV